jgi:molybdenum cofactor biosynthesis protein B
LIKKGGIKMSVQQHKAEAPINLICMIITVSDTRIFETDKSGKLIKSLLDDYSCTVKDYLIVRDEYEEILEAIKKGCANEEIDVILLNGGTGIAKRDVTIEAVQSLLEKELTGFGEIFRMLSYTEDIGSAAIMSRAIAGVANDTAIFSMPGSSGAVSLAMKKIILLEMAHVVREIRKDHQVK